MHRRRADDRGAGRNVLLRRINPGELAGKKSRDRAGPGDNTLKNKGRCLSLVVRERTIAVRWSLSGIEGVEPVTGLRGRAGVDEQLHGHLGVCLLYTSPSPRD